MTQFSVKIRHLVELATFVFFVTSCLAQRHSSNGAIPLSQPTRLDLLKTVSDALTTTTALPKLLPNLLAEIGRDPREYFIEETGKTDIHKNAIEKVNKQPPKNEEGTDRDDLTALLGGMNSGADEWWKPVEQAEGTEAKPAQLEPSRILTSHSIDQDPLAHFRDGDEEEDDEDNPQFRIRLSPRRIAGDTTSHTLTMAGGSYSERPLVNFDSSSEEELLKKDLLKYDPTVSKIFWSEAQKNEGPRLQKGPSFASVPGRFESLKYRSHEEGAKDSPTAVNDQALEHLRPFRTRVAAVPVFVPTKDSSNQGTSLDKKQDEHLNGDAEIISQEIAALKATIFNRHAEEEKSAATEERDRESEKFFSDDDSDEELKEKLDGFDRLGTRTLNIRPLGSTVDHDTNDESAVPVARPIEAERPSLVAQPSNQTHESVQAGQEAFIETIRTTVPPRFEINSSRQEVLLGNNNRATELETQTTSSNSNAQTGINSQNSGVSSGSVQPGLPNQLPSLPSPTQQSGTSGVFPGFPPVQPGVSGLPGLGTSAASGQVVAQPGQPFGLPPAQPFGLPARPFTFFPTIPPPTTADPRRYGNPPRTHLDNFPLRNDPNFQQLYTNFRNAFMNSPGDHSDTVVYDFTNDPHHII